MISFRKYTAGLIVLGVMSAALVVDAGYRDDAYEEYKNENYQEAIAILQECLEAAPNDEDCSLFMAQIYQKIQDYGRAIEMFDKTIQLAPEAHQAYYGLGSCHMRNMENKKPKPNWDEASKAFAKAVEIIEKSMEDIEVLKPEEVLKLKSDEFLYLYYYGHSLLRQKKYEEALEPLKKAFATEDGSKDEKTMQDLGMAFQGAKKKDDALALFEKAVEINPNNEMALKFLGSFYMDGDNTEKLKQFGERLIGLNPDEAKGYIYRGYSELKSGNFTAAEQTFTQAIEKDSEDASAYFYRAMAKDNRLGTSASSYQTLISDYAKAIELSKGKISSEYYFRLGRAYQMEGLLYWDRAFRHEQSKVNCKNYYSNARAQYLKAGDHPLAKDQLADVNERLHRINITE